MKRVILSALLSCLLAVLTFGQQPSPTLSFEVASIKPSEPQPMNMTRMGMQVDGGMVRYTNVALKDVIRVAYKVKDFQIEGPDWLGNVRFDISAKLPEGAKQDQVPEMLQSLLAERFKMTMHHDSKEHAIYALVPGKDGPKLKAAQVQTRDAAVSNGNPAPGGGGKPDGIATGGKDVAVGPRGKAVAVGGPTAGPGGGPASGPGAGPPRGGMMVRIDGNGMHFQAPSATVSNVADLLSRFTERPVIDMTQIEGQYDWDLAFTPETTRGLPRAAGPPPGAAGADGDHAMPSDPAPSVFDAVQAYGLKLEPRKSPMDVIVIDHIERTPTEN